MYTDTFRSSVAYPVTEYLDDVFGAVWKPLSGQSPLDMSERETIAKALRRNGGSRKRTALELKISERTLYRKMKEYGIGQHDAPPKI